MRKERRVNQSLIIEKKKQMKGVAYFLRDLLDLLGTSLLNFARKMEN